MRGHPLALPGSLLVLAMALAGCLHPADPEEGLVPQPRLRVDHDETFTNETVTFDASATTMRHGELTYWRVEPGDGTVYEATELRDARFAHTYAQGGVYEARLFVTGRDILGENLSAETTQAVVVHDRILVPEQTLIALAEDPGIHGTTTTFEVAPDAKRWSLRLAAQNPDSAASAELWVRVMDANQTLHEERVRLQPGDHTSVSYDATEAARGTHEVRITANEGSIHIAGEIVIRYLDPEE
jgi:hypothetical protein